MGLGETPARLRALRGFGNVLWASEYSECPAHQASPFPKRIPFRYSFVIALVCRGSAPISQWQLYEDVRYVELSAVNRLHQLK